MLVYYSTNGISSVIFGCWIFTCFGCSKLLRIIDRVCSLNSLKTHRETCIKHQLVAQNACIHRYKYVLREQNFKSPTNLKAIFSLSGFPPLPVKEFVLLISIIIHSCQPLLGVNLSPQFVNLYFPYAGGVFCFLAGGSSIFNSNWHVVLNMYAWLSS